ncbi:hypothetical protein Tco_0754795 [Tanacetum coccineum]
MKRVDLAMLYLKWVELIQETLDFSQTEDKITTSSDWPSLENVLPYELRKQPAIIIRGSDKEILSKEWRYRWTKIPKLVFDVKTFQVSTVDGAELSILEQKQCPLVKTLHLDIPSSYITITGSNDGSNDGPTIMVLLECLPMIETLSLWFPVCDVFEDVKVPRELPTPLFHLKYLDIYNVFFTNKHELIIAFLMKNSPNLEKLKTLDVDFRQWSALESSGKFLNCQPVFPGLCSSPVLKKVRISLDYDCRDERVRLLKILLGYSGASAEVQIIVEDSCY